MDQFLLVDSLKIFSSLLQITLLAQPRPTAQNVPQIYLLHDGYIEFFKFRFLQTDSLFLIKIYISQRFFITEIFSSFEGSRFPRIGCLIIAMEMRVHGYLRISIGLRPIDFSIQVEWKLCGLEGVLPFVFVACFAAQLRCDR